MRNDFVLVAYRGPLSKRTECELTHAGYSPLQRVVPPFVQIYVDERRKLPRVVEIRLDRCSVEVRRDLLGRTLLDYRSISDDLWVCGTQPELLHDLTPRIVELNRGLVRRRLMRMLHFDRSEMTYYLGVRRVFPGGALKISSDLSLSGYDAAHFHKPPSSCPNMSPGEFRERLALAIPSKANLPVAISGGTDSSLIAALLACRGEHVRTASMVFSAHSSCDERRFIRETVEEIGAEALMFETSDQTALRDLSLVGDFGVGPAPYTRLAHEGVFFDALKTHFSTQSFLIGVGADQLFNVPDYWVVRQLLIEGGHEEEALRWAHHLGAGQFASHLLSAQMFGTAGVVDERARRQLARQVPLFFEGSGAKGSDDVAVEGVMELASLSLQPRSSYMLHMLKSWSWESFMRALHHSDAIGRHMVRPFLDEGLWREMLWVSPWQLSAFRQGVPSPHDKFLLREALAEMSAHFHAVAWKRKLAVFDEFVVQNLFDRQWQEVDSLIGAPMLIESVMGADANTLRRDLRRAKRSIDLTGAFRYKIMDAWIALATERWLKHMRAKCLRKGRKEWDP